MDHGIAQHAARVELRLAMPVAAFVVKAGYGGNKAVPRAVLGAPVAQVAYYRNVAVRHHGVDIKTPQRRESRVGQAQPAIRSEHRHSLGQIVEGFALHPDRGLVTALKVDLFGQVLKHPGDAALRLRIGNDANGLAVGQMPPMFLRFDGAICREQRVLPPPPLRLFGELAFTAQPVEQHGVVGAAVQERVVEAPELPERLVEEAKLLVRIEDGNGGVQLVERVGVAAHRAFIFLAHRFNRADIAGEAGGPLGA